ncbi:Uncharacterized protein PECH_007004 [Penicillium ucsense]|uniref:Ima1 N-terminal domain-containing protein n=1 Tax=Penicillium ucsense TaxID=2839758 RepID=A0A8J8W3E7_9EURO|nr:Uncharacterized protein PECM_006837 [Penicillium ucsense]KAF7735210.1 Uncharacterized protein PECH_007004 [Penicillium ucsense]
MALFAKRLTCFYCGRRAAQPFDGSIRKFRCRHCEADNYLDQNGDITDPPAEDINRFSSDESISSPHVESTEFAGSNTFCSKCIRNQHLFRSSLAAYFPSSDDPTDAEYERGYAQFKKGLEERYPQVCESCGPRVLEEIRKKGYEAKSDHLRRMMDRSRASKTRRQARARSWQSLLVYAGAFGYWTSIFGQLTWDLTNVLTRRTVGEDSNLSSHTSASLSSCLVRTMQLGRMPERCSVDFAPHAGFALIVGLMSIWWNPKLRMRIEGRTGRFSGFAEYYQVQLITLVARCLFWEILKDPSASAMSKQLPPALHSFMIIFTLLSVIVSRRVVKFNTQPLVDWSDNSWEQPLRSGGTSPRIKPSSDPVTASRTGSESVSCRFPVDKLAPVTSPSREPTTFPTPPPEADEMEWTPSVAKPVLQPRIHVHKVQNISPVKEPSPFRGSLPPAPRPPAWYLRTQPSTRPIEQVVQPKIFHQEPPPRRGVQWQSKNSGPEPVFRPPSFFPKSDLNTATGLESLFERAFNMDREAPEMTWAEQNTNARARASLPKTWGLKYLRLALLLGSLFAWMLSQNHLLSIPGNYIEAGALGNASLIAGFALLEAVKSPLINWDGMEILVYITELAAAVHLGAHLPRASFEREYFDRYGKLLLAFMALQEGFGMIGPYKRLLTSSSPVVAQAQTCAAGDSCPSQPASPQLSLQALSATPWSPTQSSFNNSPPAPSVAGNSEAPSLSFSSNTDGSSFSSALSSVLPPTQHYRIPSSQSYNTFPAPTSQKNPHSFTMSDLQENDPPSDYDRDSDTETVATTATTLTDATARNIRYGRFSETDFGSAFSPRRSELGPGISGLSLEDGPAPRRVTRSQTKQGLAGRKFFGRTLR